MAQKAPKLAQFMAAPSPQKFLKIYNLRSTNAMTMKLDTIVNLYETFHFTKNLGIVPKRSKGVAQKRLKNTKK